MKMNLENLNYKKLLIVCCCLLMFGITFSTLIFPKILRVILKSQVQLKQGTEMREMWTVIPFALSFKIYLFSITNPEEANQGHKPILKEIGPYYFEEWKEKYDLVDDEEEDTITFNLRDTFIFRPDLSNGLTGEEELILPDLLLLGMALGVKRDRAPMLPLVSKAIEAMMNSPKLAFRKYNVMDLLFRGVDVDCSGEHFSVKAVCSALENEKSMTKINDTLTRFSIFGPINGTDGGRLTVYRGIKNIRDLGRVIRYQDEPELDNWEGDECNKFSGTDGTIFPPFMDKEEGVWAFTPGICRSMGTTYKEPSKYAGLKANRFTLSMGDLKNEEELHCFCRNPPDNCPLKGTMDLFPCINSPLVASLPHFLDADPILLENVIGLNPTEADHGVIVDFEQMSGTPLYAVKRLQFNIQIEPVNEVFALNNISEVLLPFFWIEEGVALNKTYTNMLKYQLILALKFNTTVRWLSVIVGGLGGMASGIMLFKQKKVHEVTPVKPLSATSEKSTNNETTDKINTIADGFQINNNNNNNHHPNNNINNNNHNNLNGNRISSITIGHSVNGIE